MAQGHIETAIEQQEAHVRKLRTQLELDIISRDTFNREAGILTGLKYALRLHRKARGSRMAKRPALNA